MKRENASQESMSPRVVKRSFVLRFHKSVEKLLQDMHPNYTPNQDKNDYELGLICSKILETLAEKSLSNGR